MADDREIFRVTLRAEGHGPPAIVRLRRWLKAALRSHGLRCVSAVEINLDGPPTPEKASARASGGQDDPLGTAGGPDAPGNESANGGQDNASDH